MVTKMSKVSTVKTTACYQHLVQCLRDSIHVYHHTTIVHWGLMGSKFYSMHKLTETIYEEMQEGIDTVAEHIRSLNIATPLTVKDLLYSKFEDVNADNCFDQEKLISGLANAHDQLAVKFTELATLSEGVGDQLTLDLSVERGRAHKKFQWLLNSSLNYNL